MVAIFEQGDIVEVSLDPTFGHEPAKKRPALVVSADDFNMCSALTVVVPITSIDNGYPMHVPVNCDEVRGFACVEQMRAIDLAVRVAKRIGRTDQQTMGEVLTRVGAVFGI